MKNILTIPIPYKQLLSGKLLILLLLTISFSLIGCVIALVINIIVGFPGVHFGNLLNMFIRVTGANIGIYISVLPIILIFCCSANNFLGGVALAFVYGYFGTFEGTLLNYYPIKASMILVDPTCGAEYGYTYHIFPAFITIVLTFLISMIILANKKKEPGTLTVGKKKKAVRKKGFHSAVTSHKIVSGASDNHSVQQCRIMSLHDRRSRRRSTAWYDGTRPRLQSAFLPP